MEYQNYEDYMRSVLGYQPIQDDYCYDMPYNLNYMNMDNLNNYYPDTYRMVYPMVCKVCNQYGNSQITNEMLENMVSEIYENLEPEDNRNSELKNGDVRNPNAREVKNETRQTNFLLRDLIKILLIREFLKMNRRPQRPAYMRRPPYGGYGPQFNF